MAEKIVRNVGEVARSVRQGPEERRRIRRRYLFDALRLVVPYVAVDTQEGFMVLSTRDRTVSKSVFMSGSWQSGDFHKAVSLIEAESGRSVFDGVFVEIGANIGTTTVMAARRAPRVVAFEPDPDNFRLLRATIAANGLDPSVETINAAVSDHAGSGFLELSTINSGEHKVSDTGTVPIELVTLDDALDRCGVAPADIGMMWIDVEGHEASVFGGAPKLLQQAPPTVMEFFPGVLGDQLDRLVGLIEGSFGSVFDLKAGGKTTMGQATSRYRHGATDLLLLP